jgi:sigma-B regulation protein RsbU (phosphoserine phosphatase)
MEPGAAVTITNSQLCDGNDADMFVTAWIGSLDYTSGHIEYVNAGHNPPLLMHDGEWHWLRRRSGPPLGIFDGVAYRTLALDCHGGDRFLLYTDGVTEAMDVNEQLYGEERLEALATEHTRLTPRELVEAVRTDVAHHAEGAEQSDDITILSLEIDIH